MNRYQLHHDCKFQKDWHHQKTFAKATPTFTQQVLEHFELTWNASEKQRNKGKHHQQRLGDHALRVPNPSIQQPPYHWQRLQPGWSTRQGRKHHTTYRCTYLSHEVSFCNTLMTLVTRVDSKRCKIEAVHGNTQFLKNLNTEQLRMEPVTHFSELS